MLENFVNTVDLQLDDTTTSLRIQISSSWPLLYRYAQNTLCSANHAFSNTAPQLGKLLSHVCRGICSMQYDG